MSLNEVVMGRIETDFFPKVDLMKQIKYWAVSGNSRVVQRCSVKKMLLEISQENTCVRVSFLIKLQNKETLAQVFSCEFCEISKNTFFYRTPPVAASE